MSRSSPLSDMSAREFAAAGLEKLVALPLGTDEDEERWVEECTSFEKMLGVALRHGCQSLVLGAWGCGVFGNDPAMVARVFRTYLVAGGTFERQFERVLFAVFDASRERSVYRAFEQTFSRA